MRNEPVDEHGTVRDQDVEGKVPVQVADVFEKAGDVAGEDLLAVEPNGPGPLQPGPLRIEFREVIRPVLRGPPERKEWNTQTLELVPENRPGVPADVVSALLEAHRHTGHWIEVAVYGLAGEKDVHADLLLVGLMRREEIPEL